MCSRCKMGSVDLPEPAATHQQIIYVSQQSAIFVFRHATLRTTGISEAVHGIDVLQCPAKP
jgi:hypothetical protein